MEDLKHKKYTEFSFYKLFWAFVIFSILGFIFEGAAYLIQYKKLVVFKGLIYGPFSQIYGFGAVIIILYSRRFKERGRIFFFISSAVMGVIYEYLCSYFQEAIFGFVSWHYENMLLNVNGRTTILLSVVWGIMGLFIVKYLFPCLSRLIDKIPEKMFKMLTWIFIVFVSFDIFITAAAFQRQSERLRNIPATSSFQVYLDEKYPDYFMKNIKPGIQVKQQN